MVLCFSFSVKPHCIKKYVLKLYLSEIQLAHTTWCLKTDKTINCVQVIYMQFSLKELYELSFKYI